jgi:glutathione S-transferase
VTPVTLWHLPISHYSEKVRWALRLKGVEHTRRALPPGAHIPVALALTRGRHCTFPVLSLDGRHIGDSTAIIAALEEAFPEPPLYPADPGERQQALALEEFFDEELGPYVRQAVFHALGSDPETFGKVAAASVPALARLGGALGAYGKAYAAVRFKASDAQAAVRSRAKVEAAFDRLEAELGDGEHLVGGRFTVADLTAASLLYPVVLPPGGPIARDDLPADRGLRVELGERRGMRWVEETYARHRRPSRVAAGVP